jgi:hypothetical protein
MKNLILSFALLLGVILFFTSCKKKDAGTEPIDNSGDTLHVILSKNSVEYNGFDYVNITVRNNAGDDVTSSCTIMQNGTFAISSKYTPSGLGTFNISAKKGTMPSDSKPLTVTPKSPSPFSQKILVEDATGAWCGYCPRVAYALEEYKAANPNCITVGIHGGSATDPYKFRYYSTYNSHFGITGYPSAIINRTREWSENNSELDQAMRAWAPLGLAINSSVSGSNITGTIKVKFNVTTDKSMKVVIALVENGLVYPQINYYAPTFGPNPITNFVHNGVLRKTATDLFGDPISVGAQIKDNIFEKTFSMTLSGSTATGTFNAIAANCAIIAYVVDGSAQELGTYNVQYAPLGTNKDFD